LVRFLKNTQKDIVNVWAFVSSNVHPDFYITENNQRIYITSFSILKKLLKQSHTIIVSENQCSIDGIIMIWKGTGEKIKRNYIKFSAKDVSILDKLITFLSWNFTKDIYIKIKKHSHSCQKFQDKNFRFVGGRGREILLVRRRNKWERT